MLIITNKLMLFLFTGGLEKAASIPIPVPTPSHINIGKKSPSSAVTSQQTGAGTDSTPKRKRSLYFRDVFKKVRVCCVCLFLIILTKSKMLVKKKIAIIFFPEIYVFYIVSHSGTDLLVSSLLWCCDSFMHFVCD